MNVKYLKHYQNLENKYVTPKNCESQLTSTFHDEFENKIKCAAEEDTESRLGVYLKINPRLTAPTENTNLLETERIIITRYRCGSHSLKIETGRLCNPIIPRENRICLCNTGIQSLHHCLLYCPLLTEIRREYNISSIDEAMESRGIASFFIKMENILNISTYSTF